MIQTERPPRNNRNEGQDRIPRTTNSHTSNNAYRGKKSPQHQRNQTNHEKQFRKQDLSRLPTELPFYELPHRNPNNRRLTLETVNKILHRFGVTGSATTLDYYQRAFTQKSFQVTSDLKEQAKTQMQDVEAGSPFDLSEYSDVELVDLVNAIPMQERSNERLEFMGDTVLSTASSDYLFKRYPDQEEGFLTKLRIEIVKGTNLAKLTKQMKWAQFLLLSRQNENRRYTDSDYLEDVFESLIGAIYFDFGGREGQGLAQAYLFVIGIIEKFLDLSEIIYREDNYKDQLLQYYHKHCDGQFPKYTLLSDKRPDGKRLYTVAVLSVDGEVIKQSISGHPKKALAEQDASKKALKYFGQEVYSESEDESDDDTVTNGDGDFSDSESSISET